MQAEEKLGRYIIHKKIGAGGMGEVYLAHDEQLARNVALKILLPEFCCDAERVQRFKLEAKAASTLNHPGIITIHEIAEENERLFIATEFVDGETLREKIEKGEPSLLETLKIAEQVADALAVAHEAGIVHRDIKPENVMIRRDGYAKILDFGLAKPTLLKKAAVGTEDETVQLVNTEPGMVMGSVRYMSPEQARGKETDEKTDVWSLGVVLYEMLTGKNPFEGETVSDSLAALIHVEPATIEDAPEELQRILRKALRKDPNERYQSIKDFSLDLKDLRSEIEHDSTDFRANLFNRTTSFGIHDTSESKTLIHHTISAESERTSGKRFLKTGTASGATGSRKRQYFPLAAIAAAAVLALGGWLILPKLLGSPPSFESIQVNRLTDNGRGSLATVSPDGRLVAFVNQQNGKQNLYVRQVATGSLLEIVPPTSLEIRQPTFSPDGDYVFYVLIDKAVGTVFQVSTLGGQSKKILVDADSSVTFSPDGKQFAFIRHNPTEGGDTIFIVNSDGTNLTPFIQTKDVGFDKFTDIAWSPDGRRMLVGVFKGAVETAQKMRIAVLELNDKTFHVIGENFWQKASYFQWLGSGDAFVFVGMKNMGDTMQIWQMDFPGGLLKQITTDTSDYVSLSISSDGGEMVTTKVETISSFWSFTPASKELKQLPGESKNLLGYAGLSQMPDGKILFSKTNDKEINLFSIDANGNNETRLTQESGFNMQPVAANDGKYIVFISNRTGTFGIWRMNADGSNAKQLTSFPDGMDGQIQISPDSQTVFFNRNRNDGGKSLIMKVSIEGGEAIALMPQDHSPAVFPRISRDGKFLAFHTYSYDSQTSDFASAVKVVGLKNNVIDNTFNEVELGAHTNFRWSPDGKSLTFINRNDIDNLWNVSVADKKETPLTEFASGNISNFAWSHDGKRLFIIRSIINSDLVLIKDTGNI